MVTAPVQKEIINRAGINFSGHTEYLAEICNTPRPVMLLVAEQLRVALVTTHLPLREVADAINENAIREVIKILARDLHDRFGIDNPHIKVCGLNPHAGENGYLGREEIEIERPTVVLPQPLSPTSPSVLPAWILKLTPSTALTQPTTRLNSPFLIAK